MNKHEKKNWKKFQEQNQEKEELEDELGEEVAQEDLALDHPSYIALEEKLTLSEQKAHENWEQLMLSLAELKNVRSRAEREVANAHRYGVEKLIYALLPVIDSLEQAIQLTETGANSAMSEGLELTMKLFLDALQKFEVEQINPQGETFDPQLHEAMTLQEAPGMLPNTVLAVFQKGYKLSDRVIRPARVIVSKAK